jgi:isopentenyldiphosphate isomerase
MLTSSGHIPSARFEKNATIHDLATGIESKMHTEYLDVVDEQDHVVEQRPRAEIHATGLRHRAIHILVFNDRNQLFLQKRSMKKDLKKGLWDTSAAGHVDAGENYERCAPRELSEELGVRAELESLFKLSPSADLGMEFIQVYRCLHNGPFIIAEDEIDEGAWLDFEQVNQWVDNNDGRLTETFRIIWLNYRQLLML